MDINDLRTLFTVLVMLIFVGIVIWAYSAKRKSSFDEAAQLVLDDDTPRDAKTGQQHN